MPGHDFTGKIQKAVFAEVSDAEKVLAWEYWNAKRYFAVYPTPVEVGYEEYLKRWKLGRFKK